MNKQDALSVTDISAIEREVVESVVTVLEHYAIQQADRRFMHLDTVYAAVGKALLCAGGKFLAESIGEEDASAATAPIRQCIRLYLYMVNAISERNID